jgi:hypothetical protein
MSRNVPSRNVPSRNVPSRNVPSRNVREQDRDYCTVSVKEIDGFRGFCKRKLIKRRFPEVKNKEQKIPSAGLQKKIACQSFSQKAYKLKIIALKP